MNMFNHFLSNSLKLALLVIFGLAVGVTSSYAGFFDDMQKNLNTVSQGMEDASKQVDDTQNNINNGIDDAKNTMDTAEASLESKDGFSLLATVKADSVKISLATTRLAGSQSNPNLEDAFGVFVELDGVERPDGGKNMCSQFLNEYFSAMNDQKLKKLKSDYAAMQGKKVLLENVRSTLNPATCVFSAMRVL